MKIVILDGYTENPGDLSWEPLAALGELTVYDRTPVEDDAEILRRIGDAEVVYTNKTPLRRAVIEGSPSLRFISVLATGYNVVDCAAAGEKGIPVTNVPAYGTAAVAQFTFALLLELCHHAAHHSDTVHAGRWTGSVDFCYWDYPLIELEGKTLGIVGFGRIGRQVGKIARAFGMQVLATGSRPCAQGEEIAAYTDLDTLLGASDVVSLHCPLTPQTQGLICQKTLAGMKPEAMLLNTSRGQLIVEQDLADALNGSRLAAAAVDVVSVEPIRADNPLLEAKNCLITPHIAWAPLAARQRILDCAAENLRAYLAGAPVNVVNTVA